jgi:hypothetical protein
VRHGCGVRSNYRVRHVRRADPGLVDAQGLLVEDNLRRGCRMRICDLGGPDWGYYRRLLRPLIRRHMYRCVLSHVPIECKSFLTNRALTKLLHRSHISTETTKDRDDCSCSSTQVPAASLWFKNALSARLWLKKRLESVGGLARKGLSGGRAAKLWLKSGKIML